MPHLIINTNIDIPNEKKKTLLKDATDLIVKELGKHKNFVMVSLKANECMSFADTTDPLAYINLESIGFSKDLDELASIICSFINEQLNILPDRVYIKFDDVPSEMYGWNNTTFG